VRPKIGLGALSGTLFGEIGVQLRRTTLWAEERMKRGLMADTEAVKHTTIPLGFNIEVADSLGRDVRFLHSSTTVRTVALTHRSNGTVVTLSKNLPHISCQDNPIGTGDAIGASTETETPTNPRETWQREIPSDLGVGSVSPMVAARFQTIFGCLRTGPDPLEICDLTARRQYGGLDRVAQAK